MSMEQTVNIPCTYVDGEGELIAEMRPDASVRIVAPGVGSFVLDRNAAKVLNLWLTAGTRITTVMAQRFTPTPLTRRAQEAIDALGSEDVTQEGRS